MKYFASKISENIRKTPEGFLLCLGVSIARTGEQEYLTAETPLEGKNGKVIVFRDPKQVFRPETIASFEGKPFTIKHPKEFVNAKNWKDLSHGHIQNVRRGAGDQKDDLVADILIQDQHAIFLVNEGMRALSCGYEADYVQTEVGRGEQTNIVGNHLALVEEGRAGPGYEIKDHKGEDAEMSRLTEIKAKLAAIMKTVDEKEEKPVEKKEEPAKDAQSMYDDLMKACDAMMNAVKAMKPSKDEEKPAEKSDKEKPEEKSGDADEITALKDRLAKMEALVSELVEGEAEESGDDGESEEDPEVEDEEQEAELTGDEKSRVEILAPGTGAKSATKDFKKQALKAAYKTGDGKEVIDSLTGGSPDFEKNGEMLFMAASELLKGKRSGAVAATKTRKTGDFQSAIFADSSVITAEKMNEINAKHYAK